MLFGPFSVMLFLVKARHVLSVIVTTMSIYPLNVVCVVSLTLHSQNVAVGWVEVGVNNSVASIGQIGRNYF